VQHQQEQLTDAPITERHDPHLDSWDELGLRDRVVVEGRGWAVMFRVEDLDDGRGRVRLRVDQPAGPGKKWNLRRLTHGEHVRVAHGLYGVVCGATGTSIKVRPAGPNRQEDEVDSE